MRITPASVTAMVALVLALGGGAYAATSAGGHQIEWAVVTPSGNLARGSNGALGAQQLRSHGRNIPGAYQVLFFNDIRHCAYKATLGNADGNVPSVGQIAVASRFANGVHVVTTNWNGVGTNEGFHLAVIC